MAPFDCRVHQHDTHQRLARKAHLQRPMHAESIETAVSLAAATKRVLIVEDDRMLARIYWKKLLMAGYAAEVASDGASGVQMAREYQPDLIVLDLMLPEMNGVEVLTKLRESSDTRELPVVVFSNVFLGDLINQARAAGATKILSKTQDNPDKLVEEIVKLIGESVRPPSSTENAAADEPPRPNFAEEAPRHAKELRRLLDAFLVRGSGDLSRLMALYQRVRSVSTQATGACLPLTAHIAAALEALLTQLTDKPNAITPSARHTVTKAVEALVALLQMPDPPTHCDFTGVNVLAVDDDPVALRLVRHALDYARLRVECLQNPIKARKLLTEKTFDLILLDIEMPELTGVQLCEQLRQMPTNANTPVVFVTAVNQFDTREEAIARGGDDLIAKPFLTAELALKALTRLIIARG